MWSILMFLNFVTFLYAIYLSVQHIGQRKFWYGFIQACIIWTITLSYILSKDFGGIILTGLFYYILLCDLKTSEEDGA